MDDASTFEGFLKYIPLDQNKAFCEFFTEMMQTDPTEFDHDFLGFIDSYVHYAALIESKVKHHFEIPMGWPKDKPFNPPPYTIYDIGCSTALQHMVFDPRTHYVGIDAIAHPTPKFFRPNCTFIQGWFSNVIKDLKVDRDNSIGIANMSLLYFMSNDNSSLELFDRTFKRKFIL